MRLGIVGAAASGEIFYTINSTTNKFNLFSAVGSPSTAVDVTVEITTNTIVYSDNYLVAAFDSGNGWHVDSTITLINRGFIYGRSGLGRQGASVTCGGSCVSFAGTVGGDAIEIYHDITIENINTLAPGGGGGGGGAGPIDSALGGGAAGGSGGSGAGYLSAAVPGGYSVSCGVNFSGGAGGIGTISSGGDGGATIHSPGPAGAGSSSGVGGDALASTLWSSSGGGGGWFGFAGGDGGVLTDTVSGCKVLRTTGRPGGYYITANGNIATFTTLGTRYGSAR